MRQVYSDATTERAAADLICARPGIAEIDLNPVAVSIDEWVVPDARIIVRDGQGDGRTA